MWDRKIHVIDPFEIPRDATLLRYVDHGSQEELYRECGYDAEGITAAAKTMVVSKILTRAI